jgi:hypothetical protein
LLGSLFVFAKQQTGLTPEQKNPQKVWNTAGTMAAFRASFEAETMD